VGLSSPLVAVIVSFLFLGLMLYKRTNLGIALILTALLLGSLSVELQQVPSIIYRTCVDLDTISVVLAAFGIMLMSQLYRETGMINHLSESLGRLIRNSKLIVSVLPAIIGLLPVAGGALMSAPLVESETNRLGLEADKKTYVNVWFRHTIFPVYPISQVLILTATLTGLTITSIIIREIPIVIAMITAGYVIGLWKTKNLPRIDHENAVTNVTLELRRFAIAFSPILATIVAVIGLRVDVSIAAFVGVTALLVITRPTLEEFKKPFKNWATYGIPLATFGAFLLRNTVESTGFSTAFGTLVANGNIDNLLLLTAIPATIAFFVGSNRPQLRHTSTSSI